MMLGVIKRNFRHLTVSMFVPLYKSMVRSHLISLLIRCFTDYSYLGLFVPWTIRTMGVLFVPWTIRTMDYSYIGLFVRWTFRTTDYSYYGLFVPSVKYSHNINCWCEKALTQSNASRPRLKTTYLYVQLWHVGYFFNYNS